MDNKAQLNAICAAMALGSRVGKPLAITSPPKVTPPRAISEGSLTTLAKAEAKRERKAAKRRSIASPTSNGDKADVE